mmetsp:Transcript_20839/g.37858  ORF Transcript_20839/g.37858 Transcript_20839/m.37858 type:complete len:126 (-) Transcript_20839:282-659(-)|eukprot:CAMPEP_0202486110 /NCGR_PEP_ID=MMETSP1361-20130828/4762_1 /ASSEMBLY_ACC=CAM_ASM_000849 /TAXON_ID=210615 /ORGANISM="Staurosira complex sp., Strain CCMP2646" /LENGTH=125 /DNA_ID=CAMNT_0049115157 /DNA_START=46 /DNA_END=423 /DNA_ORIENTATION=-
MTRSIKKLRDSSHRKETKEEKRQRLQNAKESREKCLKILPFVGGAIVGLMVLFALYVRSLPVVEPPKKVPPKVSMEDVVPPDGRKGNAPEELKVQAQIRQQDEFTDPDQLEEDLIKDDDDLDGEM